jgi:hypothetical protein
MLHSYSDFLRFGLPRLSDTELETLTRSLATETNRLWSLAKDGDEEADAELSHIQSRLDVANAEIQIRKHSLNNLLTPQLLAMKDETLQHAVDIVLLRRGVV